MTSLSVERRIVVFCNRPGKCFCDPIKTEDLREKIISSGSILKKRGRRIQKMRNDSRLRVA